MGSPLDLLYMGPLRIVRFLHEVLSLPSEYFDYVPMTLTSAISLYVVWTVIFYHIVLIERACARAVLRLVHWYENEVRLLWVFYVDAMLHTVHYDRARAYLVLPL